jgi:hypothetical protein
MHTLHKPFRARISEIIGGAIACLIVAALFNVILINALFFPDCNRITRDCFVIDKMWGQS